MIHVQFSDAKQTEILSEFAGPQEAAVYENLGTVAEDDDRLKTFRAKFEIQ